MPFFSLDLTTLCFLEGGGGEGAAFFSLPLVLSHCVFRFASQSFGVFFLLLFSTVRYWLTWYQLTDWLLLLPYLLVQYGCEEEKETKKKKKKKGKARSLARLCACLLAYSPLSHRPLHRSADLSQRRLESRMHSTILSSSSSSRSSGLSLSLSVCPSARVRTLLRTYCLVSLYGNGLYDNIVVRVGLK